MAKRKARPGREGGRVRTLFAAGFAQEGVGLFLIGLGLLSALALFTYDANDPSFRLVPVENAAGVVGASIAQLLVGSLGFGAAVPVLAVLALGVRLLTRGQLSFPSNRFWAGMALVLAALSTIPELLALMGFAVAPRSFGGWLGRALAEPERRLLSGPGALMINLLALCVGAPSLIGIAPGDTLTGIGRGVASAARNVGAGARSGASLARLGLLRIRAGVSATLATIGVWRERRARRARVAVLREPAPVAEGRKRRSVARPPSVHIEAAGYTSWTIAANGRKSRSRPPSRSRSAPRRVPTRRRTPARSSSRRPREPAATTATR
jgi:hypothetical protein